MLFNSIPFLIFFAIVFIAYWAIADRLRWIILLAASYYFYASWSPLFALLLLITTITDWYIACKIYANSHFPNKAKRWLLLSIIINIGCLFVFKYFVFFYNSTLNLINSYHNIKYPLLHQIIIPLGLSFYIFKSLSYIIDVKNGNCKPEKNLARFALYISFFPQLIAGPVERFNQLAPQLFRKTTLTSEKTISAIRIIIWGYFKKMVIADRLATFVNPVFSEPASYSGLTLLLTGFFFLVQLYTDFSGYTDIATGISRLLGIELTINWKRPLLSKSIYQFWKRYHISMTSWFRDYLYIPLGGNQCSQRRWIFNILFVFIISGLWHGANWTFIIWGAMHGILYITEVIFSKKNKHKLIISFFGWMYTLIFLSFSFIAFSANSINDLTLIYSKILHFDFNINTTCNQLIQLNHTFSLLLSIALILFLFLKELNEEYNFLNRLNKNYKTVKPMFYVFLFIILFVLGEFKANEFIYFHF